MDCIDKLTGVDSYSVTCLHVHKIPGIGELNLVRVLDEDTGVFEFFCSTGLDSCSGNTTYQYVLILKSISNLKQSSLKKTTD